MSKGPGGGVVVRQATSADLPHVVRLRLALLREHGAHPIYGRLRSDAPKRAEKLFAAQLSSSDEIMFLAELTGEVVGIIRCVHSAGSPLLDPTQYGYISSVYVIPAARRRGVLRALLASAEEWCASRGLTELRLHNASDNEAANATWADLGFPVVEHLRSRPVRVGS